VNIRENPPFKRRTFHSPLSSKGARGNFPSPGGQSLAMRAWSLRSAPPVKFLLRLEKGFYPGSGLGPREKANHACILLYEVLIFNFNEIREKVYPQETAKERPWIIKLRPPS
jgi:hypothetical protein